MALNFIEVLAAGFLTTCFMTIVIRLCILHIAEHRRDRVDTVSRYPPVIVASPAS